MNNKKIISLIAGFSILTLGSVCTAEQGEILSAKQSGDKLISISGKLEASNSDYAIQVFAPFMGAEDLDSADDKTNTGVIVFHEQGTADENGAFVHEFEIGETGVGGTYNIVFNSAETGLLTKGYTFNFTPIKDFKVASAALNEFAGNEDFDGFFEYAKENYANLAFYNDDFESENLKEVYKVLYDDVKENPLDENNIPEATRRFMLAAVISETENLENIFLYDEYFEDGLPFISHIKGNESLQKAITEKIEECDSSEEFFKQIAENLLLQTVKKHDGVDNLRKVMEDVESFLDIDSDDYDDDLLLSVSGKEYKSIEDFCDALEDEEDSKTPQGGGNGGSGKKKQTTSVISVPVETNTENTADLGHDVYTDIDDVIWARNAIVTLTDMGIVKGREPLKFYPNENVKREEFVKMIVMALADDAKTIPLSFTDTDKNAWYYTFIAKAVNEGIVKGYSDTVFGIGNNITREDLCVMAYNAIKDENAEPIEISLPFNDADEISDYAKEAVSYLSEKGVVNGVGDKMFAPKATATRAQAAKIIYMLLDM